MPTSKSWPWSHAHTGSVDAGYDWSDLWPLRRLPSMTEHAPRHLVVGSVYMLIPREEAEAPLTAPRAAETTHNNCRLQVAYGKHVMAFIWPTWETQQGGTAKSLKAIEPLGHGDGGRPPSPTAAIQDLPWQGLVPQATTKLCKCNLEVALGTDRTSKSSSVSTADIYARKSAVRSANAKLGFTPFSRRRSFHMCCAFMRTPSL